MKEMRQRILVILVVDRFMKLRTIKTLNIEIQSKLFLSEKVSHETAE